MRIIDALNSVIACIIVVALTTIPLWVYFSGQIPSILFKGSCAIRIAFFPAILVVGIMSAASAIVAIVKKSVWEWHLLNLCIICMQIVISLLMVPFWFYILQTKEMGQAINFFSIAEACCFGVWVISSNIENSYKKPDG